MARLTWLFLGANQLTACLPEIGNLTALTRLNLGSNQLTALPPEIGNLTRLTHLNLHQNQLTALPPEMKKLLDQRVVTLSENPLSRAIGKSPDDRFDNADTMPTALESDLTIAIDQAASSVQSTGGELQAAGSASSLQTRPSENRDQGIQLGFDAASGFLEPGIPNDNVISDANRLISPSEPDDAAAYYDRGYSYYRLGQHERAIEEYDKAILLNPDYDAAHFARGFSYDSLGQYERAIQDYDQAVQLDPDYAVAYRTGGFLTTA